jgi:hypothetical protein
MSRRRLNKGYKHAVLLTETTVGLASGLLLWTWQVRGPQGYGLGGISMLFVNAVINTP